MFLVRKGPLGTYNKFMQLGPLLQECGAIDFGNVDPLPENSLIEKPDHGAEKVLGGIQSCFYDTHLQA